MSAAVLAAIGISKEVWKKLPADRKKQIRQKIKEGKTGLAKILTKYAMKAIKKPKKTKGKKGKNK